VARPKTEFQRTQETIKQWLPGAARGSVKGLGRRLYIRSNGDGISAYCFLRYKRPSESKSTYAGIGTFPHDFTLSELLKQRDSMVAALATGIDPQAQQRASRQAIKNAVVDSAVRKANLEASVPDKLTIASTFWEVALFKHQQRTTHSLAQAQTDKRTQKKLWSKAYGDAWLARIKNHLDPILAKRVGAITPDDFAAALHDSWYTNNRSARYVMTAARSVFDVATVKGLREGVNPATYDGLLEHLLNEVDLPEESRPMMPYSDAPAFMRELAGIEGMPARAAEIIVMTGCRLNEVLGAEWSEIDYSAGLWTIPGTRMKMSKDHVIPLTPALVEKLKALPVITGQHKYVFPSLAQRENYRTPTMSRGTLTAFKKRQGWQGWTWHGFRATFRSWCTDTGRDSLAAELTLAHRDKTVEQALAQRQKAIELQLAHRPGGVVGRYDRADLLDARASLLEEWHAYLQSANVVPIGQRKAG